MDVPTSLYRFYDADDALLYVGVTSVGPTRWSSHEQHRGWWNQVARTTVEHFPTRAEAFAAERAVIKAEQPRWNILHKVERTPRTGLKIRAHGTGSVFQREDGRWTFIASINKRRRWVTVQTEAEALLLQTCYQYRGVARTTRIKAAAILEAGEEWNGLLPLERRRTVKIWSP